MSVLLLQLVFLVAVTWCQEQSAPSYPLGDVRNCPVRAPHDDSQPLYQMEVLPGTGFDNLRNLDMGQVHYYNFSSCQISKDGKYLLPDNVFVIPVQESKVDSYAEYFDHWDNYTSMTSNSINTDASFFSHVSAKFSAEYTSTKSHMYNDQAKSTRVQIRHKLYTVKLQPDTQLHPTFKSRVYEIASNIQNNNTEYAHYLAELMVRDYGTHYITSMDAGAIMSQMDFIKSSAASDQSGHIKNLTASASANFFGKISLGSSFSHGSSDSASKSFLNSRTHSQVVTVGGPPFSPNLTLQEWENGVANALVSIDRSGDPLHFVINPSTLPFLPENTIRAVHNYVNSAINRYYKVNTHRGCTDPAAKNFNFHANLDDSTCQPPLTNFSFGGIYQKCTPDSDHNTENLCESGPQPALQLNPLTGNLSCPGNYTSVLLHSGTVSHVMQKTVCNQVCHHCHLWSRCCHCDNVLTPFLSLARYEAYWCAALDGARIQQSDGYLFGGYYTSAIANPVTNTMSCPRFFYPLHMGEDTKVCVSNDYEKGSAYAVDFAGFESCSVGNPLAESSPALQNQARWPHLCPHGYAQHLVTVEDGCEINFCVRAGAFKPNTLYAPKLPPFRKHPKYKNNVTDTLVMFGVYGQIWVKNDNGDWEKIAIGNEDGQSLLDRLDITSTGMESGSGGGLPAVAVAVLSIVSTVVLGIIIVVAIFVGRKVVKKRKAKKADSYMAINDSADQQGSTSAENV